MNTFSKSLLLFSLLFFGVIGSVQATTYTFQSNDGYGNRADMMDLDHSYYYGWGISDSSAQQLGNELAKGYEIISADLVYTNIWNWQHELNDQLSTFLLSAPPPMPGVETVPVFLNGVPQGHDLYTYTKTTYTYTKTTYTYRRTVNSSQPLTITSTDPTVPAGYKLINTQKSTKTSINKPLGMEGYVLTNTQTSTKASTNSTPPSGYVSSGSKFVQDTITLKAGIKLSANLWERYDAQSLADVNWGVDSYLIQDNNLANANPWHDTAGGSARNFNLTYNFDENSIATLTEYALNGSFGFGIDPDCHYYNDGVKFTVVTAQVPEPTTMLLLGLGLMGLAGIRRLRKS